MSLAPHTLPHYNIGSEDCTHTIMVKASRAGHHCTICRLIKAGLADATRADERGVTYARQRPRRGFGGSQRRRGRDAVIPSRGGAAAATDILR